MRILFTTYAEKTHFFSMVPLAWALRTAGHEVRVASQPALEGTVTGTGLTMVPVGKNHGIHRMLDAIPELKQMVLGGTELAPFDRADRPEEELTWEYLRDGYRNIVPWAFKMANDPMVKDLTEYCRWWRPDLVVREPTTFAGAIAAEACGAVHARLTCGADFYGRTRTSYVNRRDEEPGREDLLRDWISRWSQPLGVEYRERMAQGYFTVDQLPEAFRLPSGLDYLGVRYVPYNGPSTVPGWLRTSPERPRVALTLGMAGHSLPMGDMLSSLAELDAEVVATVPVEQQSELPTLPDNVRVEGFVPLNDLLPTCSAVIHHGGWGTVCSAAHAGAPQVILPQHLDAPFLADCVAGAGAGLSLPPERVQDVDTAVGRLLSEEGFAKGAEWLRGEMAAMPSPNDAVPQIEELVEQHRS